jgi:hypothetical protein
MVPLLATLSEGQHQLVVYVLALIARGAAGAVPPITDQDVADAASSVAATIETAGKGIIYQHQATSLPAQRLAGEIARGIEEVAAQAGSRRSRVERDAAVGLRQIAAGASTAATKLEGDEPPVFLKLVERILKGAMAGTADSGARPEAGDAEPGSRLIIPG